MRNLFLILFLQIQLIGFAQIDTTQKTIEIKIKHNLFFNSEKNQISPPEYLENANSGLYSISFRILNDSTIHHQLDSTLLLKMQHNLFKFPNLVDTENKRIKFKKQAKSIVTFWSTICKPCIEEIETLNKLVSKYQNVNFIGITPDNSQKVKSFQKIRKFNFQIVPNVENIEKNFNVSAYPTHFLIDKNGIIDKIIVGSVIKKDSMMCDWLENE
jgi:thiol-disulfide isomerase/thioredoxin